MDSNLDTEAVWGDFSALNTVIPGKYKSMKAACTSNDDEYICEWKNLLVDGAE